MAQITLRRLRQNPLVRELSREVRPSAEQMIQPLFVVEGLREKEAIPGLTGVYRETNESLLKQVETDLEAGVRKFLLFGVPAEKRLSGFRADYTAEQLHSLRKTFGKDLFLSVDVCFCSYTSHGQCGIVNAEGDHIENIATVEALSEAALAYAQAGADCIAPSDMMDGRIGAIRNILAQNQFDRTLIMSYSAKFHSRFYGPFRVAADSAPKGEITLKDRATYQLDPGRPKDAIASALRDVEEGADILMVKPGLPYLDIIYRLSEIVHAPLAVYEVSGEYAALEVLAQQNLVNAPHAHVEAWTAFARAGAQIIISYGARNAKEWLHRYTF